MLSNWWASSRPQYQFWSGPQKQVNVRDPQLRSTCLAPLEVDSIDLSPEYMSAGVAYHHAGISNEDRAAVEQAYLDGNINVICCTSTLAVGVNLPCHLVIIKNTMVYSQAGASEYSDLEVMQMLGRAGRPQFDKSAVAVIITMASKANHYQNMVSGNEVLESKLHLNLIEHMVLLMKPSQDLPLTNHRTLKSVSALSTIENLPDNG
jgi:ATP-dependent DNA helicase HFM1/MER3